MTHFPTTFTEAPHYLEADDSWTEADAEACAFLADQGLRVATGLRRHDVPDLTAISRQKGTREYCPDDALSHWGDEKMAEERLAEDGGSIVVRVEGRGGDTAAFGLVGRSSKEQKAFLPMCDNTFALRMKAAYQGRHLAAPISRMIVAAAILQCDAHDIGLMTWGSNTAAVRACLGAGAVLVTTEHDRRRTRGPQLWDNESKVWDVRQYMRFPQSASRIASLSADSQEGAARKRWLPTAAA